MNILFVSFIDSTNLGDILIGEVLESRLFKDHDLVKYSFNFVPGNLINRESNPIKTTTKNKNLKNFYNDYFRKIKLFDKLHTKRVIDRIDNNKHLQEFEEEVKRCDLLVVGGGNAIFDLTPYSNSAYKFEKIFSISKKYNKKTFVTSIGIGPFKTETQLENTIQILGAADFITVRDQKSYNYLKPSLNKKTYLSVDPVFLLENKIKKDKNTSKVISLCLIDLAQNKDSKEKNNKYINGVTRLISSILEMDYKVNLFSTEPRDYITVYEVYNKFQNRNNIELEVVDITNFKELMELYGKTDLIIGTRMHSMIIALSQLIPVIGLSWQDKVTEMFELIEQPDKVFEIDKIDENLELIKNEVNSTFDNYSEVYESIKEIKLDNTNKFIINHEIFEELEKEIIESKGIIESE